MAELVTVPVEANGLQNQTHGQFIVYYSLSATAVVDSLALSLDLV